MKYVFDVAFMCKYTNRSQPPTSNTSINTVFFLLVEICLSIYFKFTYQMFCVWPHEKSKTSEKNHFKSEQPMQTPTKVLLGHQSEF